MLLNDMTRGGHQLVEHARVGRHPLGADLIRTGPCSRARIKNRSVAAIKNRSVAAQSHFPDEDIDDLAILIDRLYRYIHRLATPTDVSSTNHRSRLCAGRVVLRRSAAE